MFHKKTGFPEEDELVLCTVTGINPHSVFCRLDEYDNRSGMIHISEIAPGRIRNIKEHVQMGKKVVCKVLRINEEKGHIDLSLRRVNDAQRRNKLNEIKQEQLSEKIIEHTAKQIKQEPVKLYTTLREKILEKYDSLFEAFEDVVKDELKLEKVIDEKAAHALTDMIKSRIKPPEVHIGGELKLTSYAPNGLQEVKDTLTLAAKAGADVRYLGAGTYHIDVHAEDYKTAEKTLKNAIDPLIQHADKHNIIAEWTRREE